MHTNEAQESSRHLGKRAMRMECGATLVELIYTPYRHRDVGFLVRSTSDSKESDMFTFRKVCVPISVGDHLALTTVTC